MADMLRVTWVIDSLGAGGAQRLLVDMAEAATDAGLELSVVSLADGERATIDALDAAGVDVRVVERSRRGALVDRDVARQLSTHLEALSPHVVHSHLEYATILAGGLHGLATVVTLHNVTLTFGSAAAIKRRMFRRSVRRSCVVVACGDRVARAHRRLAGSVPLVVIPNPVPRRPAAPAGARASVRRHLGIPMSDLVAISIGRLSDDKGSVDLVEAFAEWSTRDGSSSSACRLVMVGSGPSEAAVRRAVERCGVGECVHLVGQRGDVAELLAASDLFVSAARIEGLPLAVLEAMAAGLAVVATDVGDVPTVLAADRGVLVSPRRPNELARAVSRLLDDAGMRRSMGARGREFVGREHSLDRWVEQHRDLYLQVAGRGP